MGQYSVAAIASRPASLALRGAGDTLAWSPDMYADANRHLLFGLLALQNGMVNQGQLVAAFQAWTLDKSKSLADHLETRGDLTGARRSLLEALAGAHLENHGGDLEKSLAAVPAGKSTRESLVRIGDPDIGASLGDVGSVHASIDGDPDRTSTYSIGSATSDGQRFRVLRPHACGGLGAVFVALDSELNREVALKQILDRHADDPVIRQRFLVEAEITGGLEHPGIVPVYGLGTYGGGRPYYAMRFVRGDSLKEAIEAFHKEGMGMRDVGSRSLELRKLLRRFLDVCNAIEYAHSRGVLHRDIKPGNVIVGKHGETLVVDWGLAKPLGKVEPSHDTGERTLKPSSASGSAETLPGSALGTPAYMSPEQAAGDLEKLGPRSDVYSLGATLFCLLTGKAPFEGDVGDLLRKVQRGEFPQPRRLDPTIDPALEAVCLKAMATEANDRYPTARALADDVELWLADEPVGAYREPLARRARRWAKRNRTAVTAAAVALVAGVVGLSALAAQQAWSNSALKRANDTTRLALGQAERARDETKEALAQSEESRKQAKAVGDFLVDALKKPSESIDGNDVKVADVLDQAAAGLEKGFRGSKATEGAMLDALGRSYLGLGLYAKAEDALRKALAFQRKALGSSDREALRTAVWLGSAVWSGGRMEEGDALLEEALRRQSSAFGPDDDGTLDMRSALGVRYAMRGRLGESIGMLEQVLAVIAAKLGPDHPSTLVSRGNLAMAYWYSGRNAEALVLYEAVLKGYEATPGADDTLALATRVNLALAYKNAGRHAEAVALLEAAVKGYEARTGPDHPQTLLVRRNLAMAYQDAGRHTEALSLYEAVLNGYELKLGPEHRETTHCALLLASAYSPASPHLGSIARFEAAVKGSESRRGTDDPITSSLRVWLARSYERAGRYVEAVAHFEAAVKAREAKLGVDHPATLAGRNALARAYESLGRWDAAESILRETLAQRRRREKPGSAVLAGDLVWLGRDLLKQAKAPEAEPLLRECLAIREKANPDDWLRFNAMRLLGEALLGQGKFADAEPLVVGGYEGMKAREARIPDGSEFNLSEAAERVMALYQMWGKPGTARRWAERLGLADLPADVFARP